MNVIGKRIAIARKAAKLTQDQTASAISVHKQTISRWESGKRTPDAVQVAALAVAFECTTDFLLGLSDTLIVRK